ncbi:ECs1072 family phage-associated protein [Klebsiella michiganensis]|uniref:ECs1072 family phage-associated protein n=1 Tax=Klebsiella TaxID=570 RepID=UPI00265F005A|nr:hypothetical protein [Klebsiella oxytoca]WKM70690.1 hypothetical protein Q2T70_20180 [Klebsiella oxytoca]
MSNYSRLWENIKNHVINVRDVKYGYFTSSNDDLKVSHRTAQLFILDVFLHQHREKYGAGVFPLRGRNALHHAILIKYKWPLDYIRSLSLSDALLALQDELTPENLPEAAQKFLSGVIEKASQIAFDDLRDDEWNQEIGELFLHEQ